VALEILRLADVPVPDVQPAGDPVPDPDPGVMEALRQRVNLMADTADIDHALREFLTGLIQPLLPHHPYSPSLWISVQVSRKSGRRIDEGDWVEYEGGDARLTKQAGRDKTLGRVEGQDRLHRPRVRWHNGQAWGKPCSLFDRSPVRVLFDFQAAERFPEAYGSYPAAGGDAQKKSLHNRATSEDSVAFGSVKPGVEEGGGIPSETSPPDRSEQTNETVSSAQPPRTFESLTEEGVTV